MLTTRHPCGLAYRISVATTKKSKPSLKYTPSSQRYSGVFLTGIQELVTRYEYITQQYQRIVNQQGDGLQVQQLKQQLSAYQAALVSCFPISPSSSMHLPAFAHCDIMCCERRTRSLDLHAHQERNPFVLVLIDGDGMIFADGFLQKGLNGGKEAAAALYRTVVAYIERETNDIPLTSRVICRVYANVKGLAETLVRYGIMEETGRFEDFVRGFTNGRTLFDFIDVGSGKDRADDKIIGKASVL